MEDRSKRAESVISRHGEHYVRQFVFDGALSEENIGFNVDTNDEDIQNGDGKHS